MPVSHLVRMIVPVVGCLLALSGCGSEDPPPDRRQAEPPRVGSCTDLTPRDVDRPSLDVQPGGCTEKHTAQTFYTARFPARLDEAGYDSRLLGRHVYAACAPRFARWLGTDESQAMRSMLSWAWFRPAKSAWQQGARWFRCDVVGGPSDAASYRPLPATTRGLFSAKPPDTWSLCARGEAFARAAKVPCTSRHDWRAVTTIKVGDRKESYPGDRVARIRSDQFCSDSVGGWLGYPTTDYDYGVTVFHAAEWKTGNRRSICWARTTT